MTDKPKIHKQIDNINNSINTINGQLAEKANKVEVTTAISNMGSASPKGVYSTLSALQTAYPTGATGIYIVSADGKWYYWNGTTWTIGGTYQSTGLSDESVQAKHVKKLTYQRYIGKGNVFKNTLNPVDNKCIRNMANNIIGDNVSIIEAYADFKEYGVRKIARLNINNRVSSGNAFNFEYNGTNRIPITDLGLIEGDTFTFGCILKLNTVASGRSFKLATTQHDSGTNYVSGSATYSTVSSSGNNIILLRGTQTVKTGAVKIAFTLVNNEIIADGENLQVDIANWMIIKGNSETDVYLNSSELINDENFVPKSVYDTKISSLETQIANGEVKATKNMSMLAFGDSITTTMTIGADGELTDTVGQTNWVTYSKTYLELSNVYNYAVSGAAFRQRDGVATYQYLKNQIELAISKAKPIDFIVVSAGTNDWDEFYTDTEYQTTLDITDMATVDMTKVYQAIRWSFWKIRQAYPDKLCFYAIPIQRADETKAKYDFLQRIKRIAQMYNFIIIDAWGESGIIKDFEVWQGAGRYLTDGLHPNTNGKQLMSKLYNKVILNTMKHQK